MDCLTQSCQGDSISDVSHPAIFRVPPGFDQEWAGARADATEVVLNVIRAGEALSALVDSFVRERGLPSATALIVLEVLRGEGGPLAPSVVASRCFLSRPALSGVMDTLERRGLLRRTGVRPLIGGGLFLGALSQVIEMRYHVKYPGIALQGVRREAAGGQLVFTLDNQQVWIQTEVKSRIQFAVGDVVHIEHGAMGSLWLAADKGRKTRVKRIS